ncbi:MAG TPA: cysteine synthase A [Tissierellaceae bacterium]
MLNSIYRTIGNTPMVKINNITKELDIADIYVKIESANPSGSIKDRAALYMIEKAEEKGILSKGSTIIEPTSGNTGIALAMIGASKGYEVILVMPDSMSIERRKLMLGYGAKILLTPVKDGMKGSVDLAEKLSREKGYFLPNQFENDNNKLAHYETTGIEILEQRKHKIDAFVAGVGTGGTVSGVGKRLKEEVDNIKVYAVQPKTSPVLTKNISGSHKIQGIGANFIPGIYDKDVVDEVIDISDEDAFKYARLLGEKEGILSGISSGANIAAAIEVAKKLGKGKVVVTVLPDTGERYLSTSLFERK